MVVCCVLGCKNKTGPRGIKTENVTFHEFPDNINVCKAWIQFTGRENFKPNKCTRICSKHFNTILIRRGHLSPMAVPSLFSHAHTTLDSPELDELRQSNTLAEDGKKYVAKLKRPPNLLEAMKDETWPVKRLETFAAAYVQHEVLYRTQSTIKINDTAPEVVECLPQISRDFALGRLAGSLGLPNDHRLAARCTHFRYQLLRYIRARVRRCARRGQPYARALADAPPNVARLAGELNLLHIVVQAELSTAGSPVRRWAVSALVVELSRVVRHGQWWLGLEPQGLAPFFPPEAALAAASDAVFKGAKPVDSSLWCRLCLVRSQQLLKQSLGGDRELRPGEALRPADWTLLDALLLHGNGDVDAADEMEMLLHWCEGLRALVVLVHLLASVTRPPPHAPPSPPAPPSRPPPCPRVAFWRAVHAAYTATGRRTSLVVLQHRWLRLLRLAKDASRKPQPHAPHPLIELVAVSFPRILRRPSHSWQALVRNGLVATAEEIGSLKTDHEFKICTDFSLLEECTTARGILEYIECRIESMNANLRHNSKEMSDTDFDECIDPQIDDIDESSTVNNLDERDVENVTLESDFEIVEEITVKPDKLQETTENWPNHIEIEIDTSKYYMSDVRKEEESLKILDDIDEKISHDRDGLKTCVIVKEQTDDKTLDVKFVDDDGNEHRITTSKTGELIFYPPLFGALDRKLMSIPRVKLKRMEETQDWQQKFAQDDSIDDKDSDVIELKGDSLDDNDSDVVEIIDSPAQIIESEEVNEVTYISDSDSEKDDTVKDEQVKTRVERLLEKCKPVSVMVKKLQESEIPRRGRMVKRVELADIDEVRRINKNILTAEVEPTYVQKNQYRMQRQKQRLKYCGRPLSVLERRVRDVTKKPLDEDVASVDSELQNLFTTSRFKIDKMIIAAIYDEDAARRDVTTEYIRWGDGWWKEQGEGEEEEEVKKPRRPHGPDRAEECNRKKIITNKHFEISTRRNDTKVEDSGDLDDMLRCTIIKKPSSDSDMLETDVATQPFFVDSNEYLLKNSQSSPVITGVCSLAKNASTLDINPVTKMNPVKNMKSMAKMSRVTKMNPLAKMNPVTDRLDPLQEAVRRLKGPMMGGVGIGQKRARESESVTPVSSAVNVSGKCTNSSATAGDIKKVVIPILQNSTAPKQCELGTPVLLRDAHTSTITLVPTTYTPTQTYTGPQFIFITSPGNLITSPGTQLTSSGNLMTLPENLLTAPGNLITSPGTLLTSSGNLLTLPENMRTSPENLLAAPGNLITSPLPGNTLLLTSPTTTQNVRPMLTIAPGFVTSQMPSQVTPQMPSQIMPQVTPQMPSQVTPQVTPQMPSQMMPQVTPQMPSQTPPQGTSVPLMPMLIPMSSNVNVIGLKDGPEDGNVSKGQWVEPGRTIPPVVLTFHPVICPKDYIAKYGSDLPIIRLDTAKRLWTIAGEYLILSEKMLPCKVPSYWTLGSPKDCTRLVFFGQFKESNPEPPAIVIGDVVGNNPGSIIDVNDSDEDVQEVGESKRSKTLKVKSFANCERMKNNVLTQIHPDVVVQFNGHFKKLTDTPLCYARILTVISSTDECDDLLRERAPLHIWNRRTGELSAMDVSLAAREPILPDHAPSTVPLSLPPALLIRHPDSRFLNDMAGKFRLLNSENALVRENQVYVFVPKTGTLLVGPHD